MRGFDHHLKVVFNILPSNTKSLWNSVKIAKDLNVAPIPKIVYKGANPVEGGSICNEFAQFFDKKVRNIVESTEIDDNINNGNCLINSNYIRNAIKVLHTKGELHVRNKINICTVFSLWMRKHR